MDSDAWGFTRVSNFARRRSDAYHLGAYEETDADDELRAEYLCPFCADDFDFVGLCCHIDEEHPAEAKNGVCPVCTKKVGLDLVGHLTMQHGSLLRVQRKRRLRRGGHGSAFSMLRKELRDTSLQSLLGGSSVPSSTEPDRLLASFISNSAVADEQQSVQPLSAVESSSKVSSTEDSVKREVPRSQLSDKEQAEKARRSEFAQGLLLSTFLDDDGL